MTSKTRAVMSKEATKQAEDILGFDDEIPAAPVSTNKDKWSNEIDAKALSDLARISTEIDETIEDTVNTVARGRLKIGKLLNDARDKFPGDTQFGKWRKATHPQLAARTCQQYQAMASKFVDAPQLVEAIGFNVAAELMNAPPALIKEAAERADTGDKMTVKEARSKKKPEQQTTNTPAQTSAPLPDQTMPVSKRKESIDNQVARIINLTPTERIEALIINRELDELDDYSKSAIIFGFGPSLCDTSPNIGTWLHIYDYTRLDLNEEQGRILDQAYSKMKDSWL